MSYRSHPLSRRVLAATIAVAVIAVIVTAVVELQLVRTADTSAARSALAAQANGLASSTPSDRAVVIDGLSKLDGAEVLAATVEPDGAASGSGAFLAVPRVIRALEAGRSVSTEVRRGGQVYLVEARPIAMGGGLVLAEDQGRVRALTPEVLGRIVIALLIGFAAAIVAALVATRAIALPLVRLAAAARRMAAGERGVPLERSRIAEVGDVEAALTGLDTALVTSESRQREFLLSISHELRTPLTAIRGYAEALGDGMIAPDRVAEVGRTLEQESTRLARFTDDLLALARLEAEDFPLTLSEVDVSETVAAAATAWRAAAEAGGVRIECRPVPGVVVRTDRERVRQVVDGLIENALRVSPPGSTVELRDRIDAGALLIEVEDGGPGLSEEDAAEAFERGRLRERYRDVRPVGTGLGLSIAARLVRRLGGTIEAGSGATGGALFRIRLPL